MGNLVDFSKLAELRAKTDRDLTQILNAELDRAVVLAYLAGASQSVFHVQASAAYVRIRNLFEKMSNLGSKVPEELDVKLKELRLALDLIPSAMDHEESVGLSPKVNGARRCFCEYTLPASTT